MLVKVTAQGIEFADAARRMERALQEFRVRGVKTNVPFLVNPNFLMRCYSNTETDLNWGTQLRDDLLTGSGAHSALNTFRNSTTIGQNLGIYEDDSPGPTNAITKYEDRNGFVYTRADRLHTLYSSSNGITEWARDVVFLLDRLRPIAGPDRHWRPEPSKMRLVARIRKMNPPLHQPVFGAPNGVGAPRPPSTGDNVGAGSRDNPA